MKKNIWILTMVVMISLLNACNPAQTRSQTEALLNSTVQINLWVFCNPDGSVQNNVTLEQAEMLLQSSRSLKLIQGLGTVVQVNGQTLILTHNHWGPLTEVGLVQMLDAGGKVLRSLTRFEFKSLVFFQDGGTMILWAPEGLGLTPAAMGSLAQVDAGQTVSVVRRQPGEMNKVQVVQARLASAVEFKRQEAWKLETQPSAHLATGDSGGGVWLNGQWIGNNWAIEMLLDANGTSLPGNVAYAAQCPPQIHQLTAANTLAQADAGEEKGSLKGEEQE